MDLPFIFSTFLSALACFGVTMVLAAGLEYGSAGAGFYSYLIFGAICLTCSLLLFLLPAPKRHRAPRFRSKIIAVVGSWILLLMIFAIFLLLAGFSADFDDAFVTSSALLSGTAPPATTFGFSPHPLLQAWISWVSGFGALLSLAFLAPAVHLSALEESDHKTKSFESLIFPLAVSYISLSAIAFLLLRSIGKNFVESATYAFGSLGTGGFQLPLNAPVPLYLVLSISMLAGAVGTISIYRLIFERDLAVFRLTELRWFLALIAGSTVLVTFLDGIALNPASFANALLFVSSSISTTAIDGFSYSSVSRRLQIVSVLLFVMGGMSGSPASGLRCIRLVAAFKQLHRELKQLLHPDAVLTLRANDQSISDELANSFWSVIFVYFLTFSICTLILAADGQSLVGASSAVLSALSNFGPALDNLQNSPTSHVILGLCMILGRLEFLVVLVLFMPSFWRG